MAYNRELSQFASFVEIVDSTKQVGLRTDYCISNGLSVGGGVSAYNQEITNNSREKESLISFKKSYFLDSSYFDKDLYVSGIATFPNLVASGSFSAVGVSTFESLYVSSSNNALSTSTGALVVEGGIGVGKSIVAKETISCENLIVATRAASEIVSVAGSLTANDILARKRFTVAGVGSTAQVDFADNTYTSFNGISVQFVTIPNFENGLFVNAGVNTFKNITYIQNQSADGFLNLETNPANIFYPGPRYALFVDGGASISKYLNVGIGVTIGTWISVGSSGNSGNPNKFFNTTSFEGSEVILGATTSTKITPYGLFNASIIPDPSTAGISIGSSTRTWPFIYGNVGVISDFTSTTLRVFNESNFGKSAVFTEGLFSTGISTFNIGLNVQDQVNFFNNFYVAGLSTFLGAIQGTISTSIVSQNSIIGTANNDQDYYFALLQNRTAQPDGSGLYVDTGITTGLAYNPISNNLLIGNNLTINGNSIIAEPENSAKSFNLLNGNVKVANIFNSADSLEIGGVSGVTTIRNALTNVTGFLKVTGNQIKASDDSTNITMTSNTLTSLAGNLTINGTSGAATILVNQGRLNFANTNVIYADLLRNAINVDIASTIGITTINSQQLYVGGDILLGGNDILASDGLTNISLNSNQLTTFQGDIQVQGNDIRASTGATNITMTNNTLTAFAGDIQVGGNDIRASDGNINIFMTSNTLTSIAGNLKVEGNQIQAGTGATNITLIDNVQTVFAGDIRVNGNDIRASDGLPNITLESNTNTYFAGDIQINGNDIKNSDGTISISLVPSTNGNVAFASDITAYSVYANGVVASLNTQNVEIKDSLINIGLIEDTLNPGTLVGPSSDTGIDVGLLMNYYDTVARKAAVFWDDSLSRVGIASRVTESNKVLTVQSYADLQVGGMWVTDCAGTSKVITCETSTRKLQNIVIDAGTF